MNDKETILISFSNSIKKLKIEQNKIILEDFLNNITIYSPGLIINYKDGYAWTKGKYICFSGFSTKEYYDIINQLNLHDDYNYGGYEVELLNLFQYNNNILFILEFADYICHKGGRNSILLGSYPKKKMCYN